MAKEKFQLDMTKGSILKNTIRFALPLIFASVLQLLYNAADLVIVSRYSGSDAMASVGATSSLTNLLVNVFIGLSLGASVVTSRKFGAGDNEGVNKTVHTSVLLSLIVGLLAGAIGFVFSKPLLILMNTPEGPILNGAVLYMKIIFIGVPASLIYNFGASILRAVGDTKRPLYILSASGIINVILNLILVIAFDMGVKGVAIATATANYISAIAVIYIIMKDKGPIRLDLRRLKLHKSELLQILKIGIPAGVQSSFFSLSNSVLQSTVNSYGDVAIAGNAAAASLEGFIYVIMNSFYQCSLTGVSQNYGAKKEKRINKTIWVSVLCVTVAGMLSSAIFVGLSRSLLGIYIKDSAEALEIGRMRMIVTCVPYFLCGIMEVLTGALRGLGYSVVTAVTAFLGTCGFRIFWAMVLLPKLGGEISILYLCWPISWLAVDILNTIILLIIKPRAMKFMYKG